jgi:phage pi2 protein 07
MTEPLWTIEDVRRFLAVESETTARKVAARPDAPRSLRITPGARRWVPDHWREWAAKQAKGD